MKRLLSAKYLLLGILVLAFSFRFWNVWNQDLFGDEAPDAFRAIGYVDYLGTSFQTQPVEWYKNQLLPWWTHLSFHDFPPLAMIIQHGFFRIFGDSLLTARLPSIILGTISAYLLYLIIKKLFKDDALALFSALFFAVNAALVWIFRTSMLEPILLFFILLNVYCFFKFLENKKNWWLLGATLGLVMLTKYTGIFLVPVYLSYLLIEFIRPSDSTKPALLIKNWRLYAAFGLALALFSPVLVYNFYLYKATGHFDLQFSYLLHQNTPEWTGSVGKTQAPFSEILRNLALQRWDAKTNSIFPVGYYGISAMIFTLAGLIYSPFLFRKKRSSGILFFWLYLFFITLMLMKIGSAHRFLTLYGPGFAFFAGIFSAFLWNFRKGTKWNYWSKALISSFFILEMIHSINNNFVKIPDYGMAKLDHYFEKEFQGKESAVIPESDNPHLNEVIYEFSGRKPKNSERAFNLIIYNDNLVLPTLEWIFYRRFFYHGIPALFVENFSKTLRLHGSDYFKGFKIYFVQSTENTLLNPFKENKIVGQNFEKSVQNLGYAPAKVIYGHDNLPMFRIYLINNF